MNIAALIRAAELVRIALGDDIRAIVDGLAPASAADAASPAEHEAERRLASLERSISEKRSELNRLKAEASEKAAKIREVRGRFGFVAETIRD